MSGPHDDLTAKLESIVRQIDALRLHASVSDRTDRELLEARYSLKSALVSALRDHLQALTEAAE